MNRAHGQGGVRSLPVRSRLERELVAQWLLSAAQNSRTARAQWGELGVTLLACGEVFTAVRVNAALVHAAAGSAQPEKADAHLRNALDGGPVFLDRYARLYYALVPACTTERWSRREFPGTECLGQDHYLGVPAVDRTDPEQGRAYWCVPVEAPGRLCAPEDVMALVRDGSGKPAPEPAEDTGDLRR